jgi:hypothetical protein
VCIDRFAHDDGNVAKVIELGSIAEILAMIKESGEDPLIARPAFGALATLAKHKEARDAINDANGEAVTREWLNYNLGDEALEAAAVSALELLAALCGDELTGDALCDSLRSSGDMDKILAAVFDGSRNASPDLVAAALELGAVVSPDLEKGIMDTFVDTGRIRKLVEMFDAAGAAGTEGALHGTGDEHKNLARRVITLHNNLRRADLHDQVEAEGLARLIDELVALHPSLAGLIDGKQPKRMLADALRNLDARLEGDDGGVANLAGMEADVGEVNSCMLMEDALDNTNGQWALASLTDSLTKLKELPKPWKQKDPAAALVVDGLATLLGWDNGVKTDTRKRMADEFTIRDADGSGGLSFSELDTFFPEGMADADKKAVFDEHVDVPGAAEVSFSGAREMVSGMEKFLLPLHCTRILLTV